MTKRARMTTEVVLNAIALSDDEYFDPEKAVQNDKFSDLEDDDDTATGSTPSDLSGPDTFTPSSTTVPPMLSRKLNPVTIIPLQSPVGPIPNTPS